MNWLRTDLKVKFSFSDELDGMGRTPSGFRVVNLFTSF
jgi:hypothetical protein